MGELIWKTKIAYPLGWLLISLLCKVFLKHSNGCLLPLVLLNAESCSEIKWHYVPAIRERGGGVGRDLASESSWKASEQIRASFRCLSSASPIFFLSPDLSFLLLSLMRSPPLLITKQSLGRPHSQFYVLKNWLVSTSSTPWPPAPQCWT